MSDSVNVLVVGTGEYTTGFVPDAAGSSDKTAGVVALTLMDLRRRGKVGRLLMAGTCGTKFPDIRRHLQERIGRVYRDMDVSFESFPDDDVACDRQAYRSAIRTLSAGDAVLVFTPDDTHFSIATDAIRHGCHVLVAKPLVKTLQEHQTLVAAAGQCGVLAATEVHKRWDPMYADACDRIRTLGDFSFFQSYMSQPKSQLHTFRRWVGTGSDISYYLNSHHIDFHWSAVRAFAKPVAVRASAATGCAQTRGLRTEDSVTLMVDWVNIPSGNRGTAVYTASWIAPPSDVHSQQRFFYQGHRGEICIDQAHRGYSAATDENGFLSLNSLFMKYLPDAQGFFCGQQAYGYRSIEDFIEAVRMIRADSAHPNDFVNRLATARGTETVTAVLEAGRISLDRGGKAVALACDADGTVVGMS